MASLLARHAAGQPLPNPHTSPKLEEDDLMPAREVCPWCGGVEGMVVDTIQTAPLVQWMACSRCGACSASRMPKQALLDAFYSAYYGAVNTSSQRVTFEKTERFGRHIGRELAARARVPHPVILDFGGGDGSLAVAISRFLLAHRVIERADVHVVDYNVLPPGDVPPGCSVTLGHRLDRLDDGAYDVVLASAVLEHIPDPRPVLQRLTRMLKGTGLLYARTPYALPLRRLLSRFGSTYATMYPAHVHDLGQPFWDGIEALLPELRVIVSRPSIVETSFSESGVRTVLAHGLKAPWRMLGKRWSWVGGWEVLLGRS